MFDINVMYIFNNNKCKKGKSPFVKIRKMLVMSGIDVQVAVAHGINTFIKFKTGFVLLS